MKRFLQQANTYAIILLILVLYLLFSKQKLSESNKKGFQESVSLFFSCENDRGLYETRNHSKNVDTLEYDALTKEMKKFAAFVNEICRSISAEQKTVVLDFYNENTNEIDGNGAYLAELFSGYYSLCKYVQLLNRKAINSILAE